MRELAFSQGAKAVDLVMQLQESKAQIDESDSLESVRSAVAKLAGKVSTFDGWAAESDQLMEVINELSQIPGYEIPSDLLDAVAQDSKEKSANLENIVREIREANKMIAKPDVTEEEKITVVAKINAIYAQVTRSPTASETAMIQKFAKIIVEFLQKAGM